MASRRMFSKRVISSARFMKLTRDAQNLYFHLCMNADDDGAVEGYPVRRAIGVEEDAYANLEGRGLIKTLDRDNEVVYITDWTEHNRIRADRIQPSMYRNLIAAAVEEPHLIEPKTRSDLKGSSKAIDISAGTDDDGPSTDGQMTDNGQPTDRPRTVHGQTMDRLGEDRLVEVKSVEEKEVKEKSRRVKYPTRDEAKDYYDENGFVFDFDYFWNYFKESNWVDANGKKVKRWKQKMITWNQNYKERHPDYKPKSPKQEGFMFYDGPQSDWGEDA